MPGTHWSLGAWSLKKLILHQHSHKYTHIHRHARNKSTERLQFNQYRDTSSKSLQISEKCIPNNFRKSNCLNNSLLKSDFSLSKRNCLLQCVNSCQIRNIITYPRAYNNVIYRRMHNIAPTDIPSVNVLDMKRLLKQKGLPIVDGFTALAVKCMMCETPSEASTLYVNKTTGYFICSSCETHGEWSVLERVLRRGIADESVRDYVQGVREERDRFRSAWSLLVAETTPLSKLSEQDAEHMFSLFDYPYHQDVTSSLSEVLVSASRTVLHFPLKNSMEHVVGYRSVEAGREDRPDSFGLHAAGLFACRAYKAQRNDHAVLVPTVRDLICLVKEKVPGALVWWQDTLLPPPLLASLERYSRLCVWGGRDNMRGVGDKLGQERCRFVRPLDGAMCASEAAASGRSLRTAVAEAPPAAHRSITTFAALRSDVYAALTNIDKARGVKWSRFPALTRLLGGHRRGELTVLTGPTGCGKTTLTAEMSLDLAQKGVNTLWGSFEIRNSRLAQTMLQQHAGVPLDEHLDRFNEFAEQFQRLPVYFLAFHGPQPIKTVMEAVEHARYVYDIAHVIIDNVQFMLGLGETAAGERVERFFRQDAVIAAFRNFATRRDCHCTLVMHPRKERDSEDLSTSSIFGSAKASQEADNVLIIQDKRLTAIRGKKFLQVAKNRFSGDLGIVPLEFDKSALSYQAKKRPPKDKQESNQPDEQTQHREQNVSPGDKNMYQRQNVSHAEKNIDGGQNVGLGDGNMDERQSVRHGGEHMNRRQNVSYGEKNIDRRANDRDENRSDHRQKSKDSFLSDVLDMDKDK